MIESSESAATREGIMGRRRRARGLALPLVGVLVVASCSGGDDDDATDRTTTTAIAQTTTEPEDATSNDEAVTTEATEPAAGDDDSDSRADQVAADEVGEGDADGADDAEPAVGVTYGGELIVGLEAEAAGLRPWDDAAASPAENMMNALYDQLMKQTADGEVQGYLAERLVPDEDFTVWTMTLRPGVTFSNGTP